MVSINPLHNSDDSRYTNNVSHNPESLATRKPSIYMVEETNVQRNTAPQQKQKISNSELKQTIKEYINFIDQNVAQDAESIKEIVQNSPKIQEIMKKYGLSVDDIKINTEALVELKKGHLREACEYATRVWENLPEDLKAKTDLKSLQMASTLHDYGKVLIPEEIINKPGRLTDEEYNMIKAHAELGVELLKAQGLDISDDTYEMMLNHHLSADGSGYPQNEEKSNRPSIGAQILMTSDVFSALKDKRAYKDAYTNRFALETMYNCNVINGKIDKDVFDALKDTLTSKDIKQHGNIFMRILKNAFPSNKNDGPIDNRTKKDVKEALLQHENEYILAQNNDKPTRIQISDNPELWYTVFPKDKEA